ncbi:MAG: TetR/AcrR family transcriptional regulator [Microscillaceae bacterium]|nr:TetR/AcrR family transcriptional regulator [Microscillaceae bacterium]
MEEKELNTEERIIQAAEKILLKEGYAGARMQQIADEAQINKAMLHYYYKSKEKLMEKIFSKKFNEFIPKVAEVIQSGATFEVVLRYYIDNYLDLLEKNPYLPLFLIDTMHRNPEFINQIPELPGKVFVAGIEQQIAQHKLPPIKPYHLLLNIIGLCVFPVLARPIFKKVFQLTDEEYQIILKERKEEVYHFILDAVKNRE